VRGLSVSFATEAATAALQARTAADVERHLRVRLLAAFGDAAFLRDGVI